MRKRARMIVIGVACIGLLIVLAFGFFVYGRATGKILFCTVPTGGCEPAIPRGSYLLATIWKEPQFLDVVCFMQPNERFSQELWVQRICGLPGDTILIEDGRLFVNGEDADVSLPLKHSYTVSQRSANELIASGDLVEEEVAPWNGDTVFAVMEDKIAYHTPGAERIVLNEAEEPIADEYAQPWSRDHFGPFVVPTGHWFMLGDNRHASFDSRAIGCVPVSAFRGTVWKVF